MSSEEVIPLSQHDLLSESECHAIRNIVLDLERYWVRRVNGFFTLGLASYLDAPQAFADMVQVRRSNGLLIESFNQLLEQVRAFFEQLLGGSTYLASALGLPGFHIFRFQGEDRSNDNVALRAHFDLQWMKALPGMTPMSTLSFTLPIELPVGGASMAIWPTRYEIFSQSCLSMAEFTTKYPYQTITYVPGRIVVHDGLILHAIGRSFVPRPSGWRITLQGHGIRTSQGWMLYW